MTNDLVFLSVFQGIAEFLPISSNGHLVVLEELFGISSSGFNGHVALHFGSLLALLIYFFKDICLMIFGLWVYDIKGLKNIRQGVTVILLGFWCFLHCQLF